MGTKIKGLLTNWAVSLVAIVIGSTLAYFVLGWINPPPTGDENWEAANLYTSVAVGCVVGMIVHLGFEFFQQRWQRDKQP